MLLYVWKRVVHFPILLRLHHEHKHILKYMDTVQVKYWSVTKFACKCFDVIYINSIDWTVVLSTRMWSEVHVHVIYCLIAMYCWITTIKVLLNFLGWLLFWVFHDTEGLILYTMISPIVSRPDFYFSICLFLSMCSFKELNKIHRNKSLFKARWLRRQSNKK